ncbi:MAG: M81 family metallopeptidase [Candidatus Latescibacterota bacterium]|nr:M81 family metallopeptidase [Candidatus Latescibacterota bacterium]
MRIGVAGLSHETNTFAAEQNDSLGCASVQEGEGLLANAHPRGFVGGFIEGVRGSGVELVPTVSIGFAHGGLVHAKLYKHCRDLIVEKLRGAQPLDGVYFALHGAMVAEAPYTDAEGCLVREVQRALGDIPMVATYDFHAIMTDEEVASVVPFANNTNPHIDGYERGLEAAGCILRMLSGEIAPVTRRVFVPIIGPNIGQSTWSQIPEEELGLPLYDLNLRRQELEKTPGIIDITILGGYGYADTPDTGMSIVATADGDAELAERMARQLAGELWARREQLTTVRPVYRIDDGVKEAMSHQRKPVLLVDLGDDPGSACPADSPAVLESLLRLGARDCALTIRDPDVVEAGMRAGVGASLSMPVGATADRRFYQPLEVSGRVRLIDDGSYMILGPTHGGWGREVSPEAFREANVGPRVVLRLGDRIDVIFSRRRTGKDRDFFKSAGIILEEKQIIAVKSNQAHRASFDPVVASTIELDSPGVSTVNYESLPFRYLPRPIWPMDRDMTWEV